VCQRLLADQGAGHRRDPYQRPAAPAALRRGDPGQPHPGQQPATHGCLGIGNGLVASLTWAVGPSAAPPPPTTSPTPTCSTSSGSRAPTQRLQHRRIEMTVVWCACRPLRGVGRVDMVAVSRRVQTLLFSDIVGSPTAFGISWDHGPPSGFGDASPASGSMTCAALIPRTSRATPLVVSRSGRDTVPRCLTRHERQELWIEW
jgi:hypothetical protein